MLELLRSALAQHPPDLIAHDDYKSFGLPVENAAKAAVLLPILAREAPTLLLTRRTDTLARHSGQISFPGGRSEADDLTPVETALRETFEETGIAPGFVTVAGYLDRYLIGTGWMSKPVPIR